MISYLEFKPAQCKDCYKCLRHCPVKAIRVVDHQAQIISDRCILCGKCTLVCPQNAKKVHSDKEEIMNLLKSNQKVIASVAPSFISSFSLDSFSSMRNALKQLGFYDASETSIGAKAVTEEYHKLLQSGRYETLISSACPAVNRNIQLYHHDALKYLAPVDSPMVAHAKIIKANYPEAKIIFIGPCIAKKREAYESSYIYGVLTFEELNELFQENGIEFTPVEDVKEEGATVNKAKYYPISRGIIKSFDSLLDNYEYLAIDGNDKVNDALDSIESLKGMFLELNSCEYACVNGPCSLLNKGGAITANSYVRKYARKDIDQEGVLHIEIPQDISFYHEYRPINPPSREITEDEILRILHRIGKFTKEDELNCGACGYDTCREKAWAVANGYADVEMCIPYMRKKAENINNEIIQNTPNGIVVLDDHYRITNINQKAISLLGIGGSYYQSTAIYELMDAVDFVDAYEKDKNLYRKKIFLPKTNSWVELTVVVLKEDRALFGVLKDITEETLYNEKLKDIRSKTIDTADEVINKQMRVAQEIASALGETVAETKVALLNLKNSLSEENKGDDVKEK